ncbi:hypothetical protein ADEAN_000787300 [Angomonas deanei]|uniref:Uncharacterized protein n=1 Tax=Angomonas deanei TaxID=59799 RepID=A0A7G2CKG1_9TRYP|nr:hypothetical protein ADEAN_000787300 [Angomonas deanei]
MRKVSQEWSETPFDAFLFKKPDNVIRTCDLHAPTTTNHKKLLRSQLGGATTPPPRLAAIRKEVSKMKDEADGIEPLRRRDYRFTK